MEEKDEKKEEELSPAEKTGSIHTPEDRKRNEEVIELLRNEAPEVLSQLSEEKQNRLVSVIQMASVSRYHHSGPLPPPEMLAAYDQHIPDGANRIMVMAESQMKHRMEMEHRLLEGQQKESARGQLFGLFIGIFGIGVGATLAYLGHDTVGVIVAGTTVVSLATAFITGKRKK